MYTQMRVTVCDIRGYIHVSDWEDMSRPASEEEVIDMLRSSGGAPVVMHISGQPRVFHQHTYIDVEVR